MLLHGKSHIGLRRSVNQDSFVIADFGGGIALCVVCDGMGGAVGGDRAGKLAADIFTKEVSAFVQSLRENSAQSSGNIEAGDMFAGEDFTRSASEGKISEDAVTKMLLHATAAANSGVYKTALENRELHGMGTTLVAAFITGGEAYTLNVGDSRLYYAIECGDIDDIKNNKNNDGDGESIVNNNNGGEINTGGTCTAGEFIQVTHDHSYVQYLIDQGKLTPEEAKVNPNRNIITRVIGPEKSVEPDIRCITFEGERQQYLLLCSDGLTNMVEVDEIRDILLGRGKTIEEKSDRMIERACECGGTDNITVVIAEL